MRTSSIPVQGSELRSPIVLSRKKFGYLPPRPVDQIAWRNNGHISSEQVFRSPVDQGLWVSLAKRNEILVDLEKNGKPFITRKGPVAFLKKPKCGDCAWFAVVGKKSRQFRRFDGTQWVAQSFRDFEHLDQGVG